MYQVMSQELSPLSNGTALRVVSPIILVSMIIMMVFIWPYFLDNLHCKKGKRYCRNQISEYIFIYCFPQRSQNNVTILWHKFPSFISEI